MSWATIHATHARATHHTGWSEVRNARGPPPGRVSRSRSQCACTASIASMTARGKAHSRRTRPDRGASPAAARSSAAYVHRLRQHVTPPLLDQLGEVGAQVLGELLAHVVGQVRERRADLVDVAVEVDRPVSFIACSPWWCRGGGRPPPRRVASPRPAASARRGRPA